MIDNNNRLFSFVPLFQKFYHGGNHTSNLSSEQLSDLGIESGNSVIALPLVMGSKYNYTSDYLRHFRELEALNATDRTTYDLNLQSQGKPLSFISSIAFNGISWDFRMVESLLNSLSGLDKMGEEAIKTFQNEFKAILENRVVNFDFHKNYKEKFDMYISPLCVQNYSFKNFTSTNGSTRLWVTLKF